MKHFSELLRRFKSDNRGNMVIMATGGMVLAICCAALGTDIGSISADRRKAQSAADLAAIVAASNLNNATSAATASLTANNLPASALVSVDLGTYTANASLAPAARFVTPATTSANAARVKVRMQTPLYFAHFFTGATTFQINTSATAATSSMAAFAIGSRLASLNGGVINGMLNSLLGTSLSLSVMDYQSLIGARIDAFDFLSALATRVNLTGVSYDTLLNSSIKVSDIAAAMLSAQSAANGATAALSSVSQALNNVTTKINLQNLIDVGPYSGMTTGQKPKLGVGVSAFDLLSAVAEAANGTNQVATSLNVGLPGIASVSLTATIGQRPQGSGWLAIGSQGATVRTAQTRAMLSIQLIGSGAVSVVNLPVYVEVASGTATLKTISCGYPSMNTSTVTLGVTPGIVDAWIANISTSDFNNVSVKPNPPAATLVNLGLVTVTGRAHASMGNTTPTDAVFSYADIQANNKKTVTTTNFTSSLTGSLLGDLQLGVTVGPLGLGLPGVGPLVTSIISGATGSIDQVLASVLATLGVGIGQADVWVSGLSCSGAVLVN